MSRIAKGTWVEIERVLLKPEERTAPGLPPETKGVPYVLRVAGFLKEDATIGDETEVRTLIGRTLKGTLTTVNPSYHHSFGNTVPELLDIGLSNGDIL